MPSARCAGLASSRCPRRIRQAPPASWPSCRTRRRLPSPPRWRRRSTAWRSSSTTSRTTQHNTTRFVILAGEPADANAGDGPIVTTFIFRVRNVPAALYKAMGGFATNGVNMTKLESYQLDGRFVATMFYADVRGASRRSARGAALEELGFFSTEVHVLGGVPRRALYGDPGRTRSGQAP